jgi:hypothetical protein
MTCFESAVQSEEPGENLNSVPSKHKCRALPFSNNAPSKIQATVNNRGDPQLNAEFQ